MIYAIIIICNSIAINNECLLLSDTRGPYYTIDQCLSRINLMHTDSLKALPKYKLDVSHCRTQPGQAFGSEKYPNSSKGAWLCLIWYISCHQKMLEENFYAELLSAKMSARKRKDYKEINMHNTMINDQ